MTMINELLFIKEFRERKAETELQTSRARLSSAAHAEREAEQLLETFIAHATQEELRMYEDLCSRVVRPRDITDVHTEVSYLKAQEIDHRQDLESRQQQLEQARVVFNDSTRKMRDASTAREKFGELARTYHTQMAREAERKEELELEELASIVREREEWGGAKA